MSATEVTCITFVLKTNSASSFPFIPKVYVGVDRPSESEFTSF